MRRNFKNDLKDRLVRTIEGLINYDTFTCLPNKWKLCRLRQGFRDNGVVTEPVDDFVRKIQLFFPKRTRRGQGALFHSIFGVPLTNDLLEYLAMGYADTIVDSSHKASIAKGVHRFFEEEFPDLAGLIPEQSIHSALVRLYDLKFYDKTDFFSIDQFLFQLERVLAREYDDQLAVRILLPMRIILEEADGMSKMIEGLASEQGDRLSDSIESLDSDLFLNFLDSSLDLKTLTQSEMDWLKEIIELDFNKMPIIPRIKGVGPRSDADHSSELRPLIELTRKYNLLVERRGMEMRGALYRIFGFIKQRAEALMERHFIR
jgi:hypothetical protein